MLAAPPGPWRQRPRSAPQRARLSSSKPLIGCSFPWIQKFGGVLASSRWYSRVCFFLSRSLALPLSSFANNADVSLTSLDKRLSRQVGRGRHHPDGPSTRCRPVPLPGPPSPNGRIHYGRGTRAPPHHRWGFLDSGPSSRCAPPPLQLSRMKPLSLLRHGHGDGRPPDWASRENFLSRLSSHVSRLLRIPLDPHPSSPHA